MAQYGFYDRLTAAFPSQILVDVAESCNLGCIHCPHPTFKKSSHYTGASLDPALNSKLVDEVATHGRGLTQYIRYASNGEPLMFPKIYDMLGYAKKNSGTTVTLTTNGVLLSDKNIELLMETGVDVVDISIDAFSNEAYKQIRKGNLDITRRNVLALIQKSKSLGNPTKVVVSYVEQDLNRNETKSFQDFWEGNGADYVVIRRLHSCSGAKTDLAEERRKENLDLNRRACLYPWERVVLTPRGELAFCPSDWVHGSVIGDYRNLTVKDVWQGEFYQNLRQAHLTNNYQKHSFCGQCPDWKSTRWPGEGRSYANMVQEFKELE